MPRKWLIVILFLILLAVVAGGFFLLKKKAGQEKLTSDDLPSFNQGQGPKQNPEDQNQTNPLINHQAYLAISQDGKTWPEGNLIRKSASVPEAIQLQKNIGQFKIGTLLVYFVDAAKMKGPLTEQIGVISSSDLGQTFQEEGAIELQNKGNLVVVDPSLIQLDDGTLRLYFFDFSVKSNTGVPNQESSHNVYSAVSKDGLKFTLEQGVRFQDNNLTDPEVIQFQNQWLMYYSTGQSSKLAISSDGLNFKSQAIKGGDVGGVPGALALENGVKLFGCGKTLNQVFSKDGLNFQIEIEDIFQGQVKGVACDPSPVKLQDSRYLMVYKTIEKM